MFREDILEITEWEKTVHIVSIYNIYIKYVCVYIYIYIAFSESLDHHFPALQTVAVPNPWEFHTMSTSRRGAFL